ncbi:MAG: glycoside hydrolase family 3 N-terminal domain-containing protein [Candidatus Eremiobacteraeota bacterium]|nr:glycoside hydrolase family 3 N-terminal domain-containing protein [Candidatus Eremiobacteraeota bacterium]
MKKAFPVLLLFALLLAAPLFAADPPPQDIEARIEALLGNMSLEEKLGQMTQYSEGQSPIETEVMTGSEKDRQLHKNKTSRERFIALARRGMLGSLLNCIGAAKVNELQKVAVKESKLGIPIIFGYDVIHGYRTIFPIPLGQAASWNPGLVEKGAQVAAREAASEGIHWTFSPMVDIARDPRWGRIAEGSGEDPFLTSVMARAQVRGYQGSDLSSPSSVAACAKHYVGYGAAIAGRDYNTTEIPERSLREIYLPSFKAAVLEGVATFMSAFNDLNGVPTSGNRYTLTTILRDEWKFKGFVVSDWESILQLIPHGFAANRAQAGMEGVLAGVDMDMADGIYQECLPALVNEGKVPMAVIDESVRRILRIKFQKGLFENPYTDITLAPKVLLAESHKTDALAMARETIVLLKNEGKTLPLKTTLSSVAVVGPLANDGRNLMGSWYAQGRDGDNVPILFELRKKLSPSCKLTYSQGCPIEGPAKAGEIEAAVKAAKAADVVVAVLGERGDMCGEAASRSSIDLPGRQQELLEALHATEKPVVLVLLNGRPLTIQWAADHIPSIVEAWFPGTMGARAIADVIFGDYNPGGKLPVTFPRNVGQIPIYYSAKNTGRPASASDKFTSKYLDVPVTPLYPFGHGLSYTTFEYSGLELSSASIKRGEDLQVSVTVKNTGAREGDEVVQLYIRDHVASATRPLKELKAFSRIHLVPGEARKVSFTLTPDSFAFYNREMVRTVEAGAFSVFAGGSSQGGLEAKLEIE